MFKEMVAMNKEANMKTILDIAKECGAEVIEGYDEYWLQDESIVFENEAQLTATIEAWNRQNSEKVVLRKFNDETLLLLRKGGHLSSDGLALLQSLPQPPASQELLTGLNEILNGWFAGVLDLEESMYKICQLVKESKPVKG